MTKLLLLLLFALPLHAQPKSTLEKVKAANTLRCAVDFEEAEYSTADAHGNHSAFDLDLCKAVAVAVLGPNAKFSVIPFRDEEDALKGLLAGEADLLATASSNFRNEANPALRLTRPVFFDHQSFLVNQAAAIHSSRDLASKKICFLGGTEIEVQLTAYMARQGIRFLPFPFQEEGEMEAALLTGNCAAVTADISQLAFERIAFSRMAAQYVILPEIIAQDPLSLASRSTDPQWSAILEAVPNALLLAEESNVTQSTAATLTQANLRSNLAQTSAATRKQTEDPNTARLLGLQRGYGQYLGLDDGWAARAIAAVGNYAELFDRTLGPKSPMRLPRAENALPPQGGLLTPTPIR